MTSNITINNNTTQTSLINGIGLVKKYLLIYLTDIIVYCGYTYKSSYNIKSITVDIYRHLIQSLTYNYVFVLIAEFYYALILCFKNIIEITFLKYHFSYTDIATTKPYADVSHCAYHFSY